LKKSKRKSGKKDVYDGPGNYQIVFQYTESVGFTIKAKSRVAAEVAALNYKSGKGLPPYTKMFVRKSD
jgi:hypothetical protein